MKIKYCIHSIYNPGGMERVLLNKACWLSEKLGWDVTVVTTDQHGRPPFYPFPERVRMIDLGINYSEDNCKPLYQKIAGYLRKRRKHKELLTELLMREEADLVVSLYPSESSFIPDIKDGSKKVLELHFCKFFRLQYGRKGMIGLIDRLRTRQDERIAAKFDKFVVLTNEDRGYWGDMRNIEVIPNAAREIDAPNTDVESSRRIIAVGRMDYQKGYDRLVEAWRIVKENGYPEWTLDIFGQGEWREMLQERIDRYGLQDSMKLNAPTKEIEREYEKSAMLVMSSNYEGFPMVMIEAMAAGLPVVAFDFKCGPRDIIDGDNGVIVENGDVEGLAKGMMRLMEDEELRGRMSEGARKVVERYSEEVVMEKWVELFEGLGRRS